MLAPKNKQSFTTDANLQNASTFFGCVTHKMNDSRTRKTGGHLEERA